VIRPILPLPVSANHRAPSGPAVMSPAETNNDDGVGRGN
jgi:hypothetical protein